MSLLSFLLRRLFILRRKLRARAFRVRIMTILIVLSVPCLMIFPVYILYKPPRLLIRYFQYRWPDVLWRTSTSSKVVALTIDDGPSQFTPRIMEVLKYNNATATFFIIGSQTGGRERTLRELVFNGNELGNHG